MNATNPDGGGGETSSFWPPQLPSLHTLFLVFFSTIAIIIARIWLVSEDPVEKRLRMKEEKKRRRKEEGRRKDGVKTEDDTLDTLIDEVLSEVDQNQKTGMGEGTGSLKWTQNDAEVDVYIQMPDHTNRTHVKCTLTAEGVSLYVKERMVLSGKFWESINLEGSNWQLEDPIKGASKGEEELWGSLWIQLEKARPAKDQGEWWRAFLQEPPKETT